MKHWLPNLSLYVHTVEGGFLLHFRRLLSVHSEQECMHRCAAKIAQFQNCSHCICSFRITSQLPSQIITVHSCLDNSSFTNIKKRFRCNFCSDKVFTLGPDRFKPYPIQDVPLATAEWSSPALEQKCSPALEQKLFQN